MIRLAFAGVVLVLLVGCVDPPSDYGPVQADVIAGEAEDFDNLWDTVVRVLRQYDLRPDRQDRREGVITTFPITSQQWFEFWRHDAFGPYQWMEASMHTMQRQAVIRILRQPESGRYRMIVKVDVFRYSAPERQVTTPSAALGVFSAKVPTEAGEVGKMAGGPHWVLVGRDPRMEGVLLRRILIHYSGTYELITEPDQSIEDLVGVQEAPGSQPASSRPSTSQAGK